MPVSARKAGQSDGTCEACTYGHAQPQPVIVISAGNFNQSHVLRLCAVHLQQVVDMARAAGAVLR